MKNSEKNWQVCVNYDTGRPHKSLNSYQLGVFETTDPVRNFAQSGPVHNNNCYSTGVFNTKKLALEAALNAIGVPCQIVEKIDYGLDGLPKIELQRVGQNTPQTGCKFIILARATEAGVWLSA